MDRNELIEAIFASMQAMQRAKTSKFHTFLERYGLTPSELELLLIVKHTGSISLKELGSSMKLTPGAISQLVNNLVGREYLDRQEDAKDRRISQVSLTAKAKSSVHKIWDERTSFMLRIMEDLTIDELRIMLKVQQLITAEIESNI